MDSETQAVMFADVHLWKPRPSAEPEPSPGPRPAPRLEAINRNQLILRPVDVDQLIPPDHPARAIWELVGQCDLSRFYEKIQAVEGVAGRPPRPPQLLISLLIYGYQEGIPSCREIAERSQYHPAYQWLTGAKPICAHLLSDFRSKQGEGLRELMAQVLALLASEGMVDLEQVTQDGTKVRASAGSDTFRRKATLQRLLEQARERVKQLESEDSEEVSLRSLRAQQRGAREKLERLEKAKQELEKLQATKASAEEAAEVRISVTDPDARRMQYRDGGVAPSYNVQVTTDAKQTVIVSVEVTQDGNDAKQLQPAMQRVEQEAGQAPQQVLADSDYTSRENVVAMAAIGLDLIGPAKDKEGTAKKQAFYKSCGITPDFYAEAFRWDAAANCYVCPEGKTLRSRGKDQEVGQTRYRYTAARADCADCAKRGQCCPKSQQRTVTRTEEAPEMVEFRAKMETEAAQQAYRRRAPVAEFPNACIKQRYGLRQFSLRGLPKVDLEALWAALTFNVQQWTRLCWRPRLPQLA
jgi:transposase